MRQEVRSLAAGALALAAGLTPTSVAAAQGAVQWRVEDGGNGHWYQTVQTPSTWLQAAAGAATLGGHLATIGSQAENLFVFATSKSAWVERAGPWIGGRQAAGAAEPGGGWHWVTGEAWDYDSWGCRQPDNYDDGPESALDYSVDSLCGAAPQPTWNDAPPTRINPSFIIEWSADCNGDGIVDYGQILDGTFVDVNSNGIPDACETDPCPGDVNESGMVNAVDLAAVLASWGTDGGKFPRADANRDGTVDALDLAQVLSDWGPCPE